MYKVTAVTKSTIYPPTPSHRRAAVIKNPKKVLINILIFELKAVGKIFSKRKKIFFVDCKILENVYICQNLSKKYTFFASDLVDNVVVSLWQYCQIHMTLLY